MNKVDSTRLLIFNSEKGTFCCWPSRPLRDNAGVFMRLMRAGEWQW